MMNIIETIGSKYELSVGNSKIIVDSFGAKVLAFYQNDENRLYYDAKDISHSGIPLCFPSFGPLKNNELRVDSGNYVMKQHGFARDMEFSLFEKTDNSIMFELISNEETMLKFPFEFSFKVKYTVSENELLIAFTWQNKSDIESPLSPGVHPYFRVYEREGVILQTNSLSYNLSDDFSEVKNVLGSEFLDAATQTSFIIKGAPDINLINHNSENTNVLLGDNKSVVLKYSSMDFDRLTVWRKNAKEDYICVEPANAQNKINDNPLMIDAGGVWESKVIIKF